MYIKMYTQAMAKSYSVADARANLPDILNVGEAGKEVHLTRRGRLVEIMLSAEKYEALRRDRCSFGDGYRTFVNRCAPEDIALDRDFFDSIRDRASGRKVRL